MNSTVKNTKWWEKTVEYNFIVKAELEYGLDLLSPLDGDVESIGDAVFGKESHFFIIEFKKELSGFSSEYKKFREKIDGYNSAKIEISDKKQAQYHYVIGGKLDHTKSVLQLEIARYFDAENILTEDKKSIFSKGMNSAELSEYTTLFTNFKNADDEKEDSEKSGSGGLNHSFVLAIDIKSKKATMISTTYFKKHKLDKTLENTIENTEEIDNNQVNKQKRRMGL